MNEQQEQAFSKAWDFQVQLLAEELAAAKEQMAAQYRSQGLAGHPPAKIARVSLNIALMNLLTVRSQ